LHGEAVAIGMVQEADLARYMGLCPNEVAARQHAMVREAGLPDRLPRVGFSELWGAMQHDKKVAEGRLYCVLPERVGRVVIEPLERATFKRWFASRGGKQDRRPSPRHAASRPKA